MPVRMTGLDHVQLAIPAGGEDEARAFYAGILRLTEVERPQSLTGQGGCWFRQAALQVHLGVQESFVPARKAHPAFLVDDLETLRASLQTAGVGIQAADEIPGVERCHAHDPFGNRIEFIQGD